MSSAANLQALSTDEAFVRVAKRVYALHAFHPTLRSTFVPAHNKRPRKANGTQDADKPEPKAVPSHLEHELHGTASSHLVANGVFVGQQSHQPDFEAQEGQAWADRGGDTGAVHADVNDAADEWATGQPEMSGPEKVRCSTCPILHPIRAIKAGVPVSEVLPCCSILNQRICCQGVPRETHAMLLWHGRVPSACRVAAPRQ